MRKQSMSVEETIQKMVDLGFSKEHAIVYIRAKGRCEYCGIDVIRDRMAYAGIQLDHVFPLSKDGTSDQVN